VTLRIALLRLGILLASFGLVGAGATTFGWSCKQGDGAETGFATKGGAESAAKAHRDSHPGHETVIDEVSSDSPRVVELQRQLDNVVRLAKQLASSQPGSSTIAQTGADLDKAIQGMIASRAAAISQLDQVDRNLLRAYEKAATTALAESLADRLAPISLGLQPIDPSEFLHVTVHPAPEPIDQKEISCGFYGPYHAQASCPARTHHAECWCDASIFGWGKANCGCKAGAAQPAPEPPPPAPDQRCAIRPKPYACNLGGAGVSGIDPGCAANCVAGFRAVCQENSCRPPDWKQSVCYCIPK
jgi:hypothetical protein